MAPAILRVCTLSALFEHTEAPVWVKEMPLVWVMHVGIAASLNAQAEVMAAVMQMRARKNEWGFCKVTCAQA